MNGQSSPITREPHLRDFHILDQNKRVKGYQFHLDANGQQAE
jgi:hypothetical protein